jgi:hypothetical protein
VCMYVYMYVTRSRPRRPSIIGRSLAAEAQRSPVIYVCGRARGDAMVRGTGAMEKVTGKMTGRSFPTLILWEKIKQRRGPGTEVR